jgi:dUTP pyrophosphatase
MTNENLTMPLDKAHIIDPHPEIFYTRIGFKKVHPDAKIPTYAHEGDAGMDVYAVEDVLLDLNTPTLVKTGLIADIPRGVEIQVRPRSGLALKGVTVFNAPGTIDCKYRGEIGVILLAVKGTQVLQPDGEKDAVEQYWIHKGDRIAQLVVAPTTRCEAFEVSEVGETDRGTGGFGSTGV